MMTDNRRLNFTARALAALPIPEKKRVTYRDVTVPELGAVVFPSGVRSYFWFRRVRGVAKWMTIGAVESLSVEQARDAARSHSAALATWRLAKYEGPSPFENHREEMTFGALLEDFIERHVKPHAKNPARAERSCRGAVDFYLSAWKSRKISTVSRTDVLNKFTDVGKTAPYAANRLAALVRGMFNFAIDAEIFRGANPAARVKFHPETSRTRFLSGDELARLFATLKKLQKSDRDLVDFVNLSLWTGARKSDVFSMRWDDVRLDDNKWTIPNPKSGKSYDVPLTPEAVGILEARKKIRRSSPFVFPSHGKSGHVEDLKTAWRKLLKKASINNLRIHDLRRTQGSWQAGLGTSLTIIGKSLGHSSLAATQIYARLDLDPVRAAMTASNWAMAAAARRKPRELVARND
jgi:integrase